MMSSNFLNTLYIPFKHPSVQICPCRKIGQDQHRVIIYVNFASLGPKFQDHRTYDSGSEGDF